MDAVQELATAVYSENLHALGLVHNSFFQSQHSAAQRNFFVMREISVVVSWMDPRLVVIVSYSDGEGSGVMIDVAVWKTGTPKVRAGTLRIEEEVREL